MRLKNIKLAGFKSFVDPTNVQLGTNMVAVIGPNGCGKTTSIGMMLGLITPTNGEILINDKALNTKNRINLQ